MTERDDTKMQSLLAKAAAGDTEAAGRAVVAHDDRLRRIVRVRLDPRLASRVDPDDVLQETHVEALGRFSEFLATRRVPLFIWLRFLAVQRCITLSRRPLGAEARDARRERPLAGGAGPDATSVSLAGALAASMTSPSGAVARDETRTQVQAAVDALEPPDREILCMRHFEELDNAEAAAALRIAPSAASKRYLRALVRLKDALSAQGLGPLPAVDS